MYFSIWVKIRNIWNILVEWLESSPEVGCPELKISILPPVYTSGFRNELTPGSEILWRHCQRLLQGIRDAHKPDDPAQRLWVSSPLQPYGSLRPHLTNQPIGGWDWSLERWRTCPEKSISELLNQTQTLVKVFYLLVSLVDFQCFQYTAKWFSLLCQQKSV